MISSNITSTKLWALKPLLNPHWYSDDNGSMKVLSCLLIIASKIFQITGRILAFFRIFMNTFLNTGVMAAYFKMEGNLSLFTVSLTKSDIY